MENQTSLADSLSYGPPVTVDGPTPVSVTADRLPDVEITTERVEIVCSTGSSHTAAWTGPTVGSLLEAADAAAETTHLVVESTDEYRVVIPIREALGGVLAYLKDDVAIGAHNEYANRFVTPETDGARDIKGVATIEPVTLDPGEDPESLENLFPEGERYTAHRVETDESGTETDDGESSQKTSES
ncbi:MAG: molybdopterin-dependent oxidoreductase [Halodesulfurarchaeum sp.]